MGSFPQLHGQMNVNLLRYSPVENRRSAGKYGDVVGSLVPQLFLSNPIQSGGKILKRLVPNKIFDIQAPLKNSCEKLLNVNFGRHNSFMVQIELIKLIKQKRNQSVGSSALQKP